MKRIKMLLLLCALSFVLLTISNTYAEDNSSLTSDPVAQVEEEINVILTLDLGEEARMPSSEVVSATQLLLNKEATTYLPADRYAIENYNMDGDWVLLGVTGYTSYEETRETGEVVTLEDASPAFVIVHRNAEGIWEAVLEKTPQFDTLLADLPETLMELESKQILLGTYTQVIEDATTAYAYKFPWAAGVKWRFNQSWHIGRDGRKSLDLAIRNNQYSTQPVLAPSDGYIEYADSCGKSGYVIIKQYNKSSMRYFHFDKNRMAYDRYDKGKFVRQGQVLGYLLPGTWDDGNCGKTLNQPSDVAHVHWEMPRPTDGTNIWTFDGWTIDFSKSSDCFHKPNINACLGYEFYSSNVIYGSIPRCRVPTSGDWNVTSSCQVDSLMTVRGNITVPSGIKVTVTSTGVLDVDMLNYKVTVKSGGGILIKNGGRLD